jgi:hypothetical protein
MCLCIYIQIIFTLSCGYNCEAKGSSEQNGIGQFVYFMRKLPDLYASFQRSIIFGCPGGGTRSFYSNDGQYDSPVYLLNDPNVITSTESYAQLQYDYSNLTHSFINNGAGSVCSKNSKISHVQYCYILNNEITSPISDHGFIEVSMTSQVEINFVILKINTGSQNSLIVLDDVSRSSLFSSFRYLFLVDNDCKYFIFLKNGCQVKLEYLFYQNNFPITNIGLVQDDTKSNLITYANSLQNSRMTISYESVQLDCDNVYFEYTKSASTSSVPSSSLSPSPSESISPSPSISISPSLSESPTQSLSSSPVPTPPSSNNFSPSNIFFPSNSFFSSNIISS